jgi:hypothetical protein
MMAWVSLLIAFSSPAFSDAAKFKLDDPPFYTMTFEEVQDLTDKSKDAYVKELASLLRHLKPRTELVASLATLGGDKEGWNRMRAETFETCQSALNKKICGDLLNARRKIFLQHASSHDGTYGSGER